MKIILAFFLFLIVPNEYLISQLVINEVMHLPVNKEPEWIELLNFQNDIIDSTEIVISDPKGSFPVKLRNILPYQYIVIVKDTNLLKKYRTLPDSSKLIQAKIPTLNNTGDSLVLRNKKGELIDFFYFGKDFGRSGISLERINPKLTADNKENIQPCISPDSASCGKVNSLSFKQTDTLGFEDGITITPNPFSPISGVGGNKSKVQISSKDYITNLKINIYDTNGNLIKNLINTTEGDKFTKKEIEWDGSNNANFYVQVGAYPVIIDFENELTKQRTILKKIIVVGN